MNSARKSGEGPRPKLTDLVAPAAADTATLGSASLNPPHALASSATLSSVQMDQPATLTMNKVAQNKTTNKMTYLLDHLLKDYDNSLRPDIGGEAHLKNKYAITHFAFSFLLHF